MTAIIFSTLIVFLLLVVLALLIYAVYRRPVEHAPSMTIMPTDTSAWWLEPDGTIGESYAHPQETGYGPGFATGKSIYDFFHGEAAQRTRFALENHVPTFFENMAHVGANSPHAGERRYYRVALVPQADGRMYCSAVDITRYKAEEERLKARLEQYQDDLHRIARTTSNEAVAHYRHHAHPPLA